MNEPLNAEMVQAALRQLQENWKWYFALGIGLVILGMLAVIFTVASTLVSVIFLGILFMTIGVFEGIKSLKLNQWGSFFLHLFLCVVYLGAGILMVLYPTANAVSLTLLLALFFVITGILRMVVAFTKHVPHQILLALNGLVTLILGILIWSQWPYSGLWALGMLVGIDMIFTGWTWIMISLRAKNMPLV